MGEYLASGSREIALMMAQARDAQQSWLTMPVVRRTQILGGLRAVMFRRLDELVDLICALTGKTRTEALLGEIYPVISLLDYYQRHAPRLLASQVRQTSPLLFPGSSATVHRRAFGVVAVISPWNFPFQLTMTPLLSALFAGNGVIAKPSELSLPIGAVILSLFQELGLPERLLQIAYGDGQAGGQLIAAAPDLVCFTGSAATGRKVMAAAAQHPVPVILELGGKDAMLVFADAHLERAAKAAVYGAFCNNGQVCVSVERCYVEQSVYPAFIEAVCANTATLKFGLDGDLGAVLGQFGLVEAHYHDALRKGAKASGELKRDGNRLAPVVLWDVDHGMAVMQEETFGPLLPVMPFNTENQALEWANASRHGLNASIWTSDLAKGRRIGRQLRVGNFAVNDVIKNIGHPGLPFGGVGSSGFGRQRGPEGLLAFTYPVSELANTGQCDQEPNWFPYSQERYQQLKGYLDFFFGAGTCQQRACRNLAALVAMRGYATLNLKQRWQNFKHAITWHRGY